jgi:TetR/AcrR family transcriptional regulator, mexJK operon transcriptional repressor
MRKSKSGQNIVSRDPEVVTKRILDAAQREFMQAGYERANTNRIVEQFGGSKATLFRYFPTKKLLFAGVLRRIAGAWPGQIPWTEIAAESPENWLVEFGCMALAWVLREDTLFLARTAVAEGSLFPELSPLFPALVSEPWLRIVSGKLKVWTAAGLASSTDPERDALSFFDLALSGAVSRALYGIERLKSPRAIRIHMVPAVRLYLDGISSHLDT